MLVPEGSEFAENLEHSEVSASAQRSFKPGAPVIRSTARVARRANAAMSAETRAPAAGPRPSAQEGLQPSVVPPVRRRASAVSRAPDGRFVAQDPISDPSANPETALKHGAQSSSAAIPPAHQARRTVTATVVEAEQTVVGASYAAQRLEQAEAQVSAALPDQRSLIPRATPRTTLADELVLPIPDEGPVTEPESEVEVRRVVASKTSPGVRAAARAVRTPLVGYTAARSAAPAASRPGHPAAHTRRSGLVSYAKASTPETVTITVPIDGIATPLSGAAAPLGGAAAPLARVVPTQSATNQVKTTRPSQATIRAARATHGMSRPLDWTGARVELLAPELAPSPGSRATRARARTSDSGAFVSARTGQPSLRRPSVELPSKLVLPEAHLEVGEQANEDIPPDRRVGFDHTVRGVGAGRVDSEMPIWAQRATGAPRIRGSEDLVDALVKAGRPDQVVAVLMERSSKMSTVASALPTPVIQVIQQIQTEAGKIADEAGATQIPRAESGRSRPGARGKRRSTARVVRGMTGLRPTASASSTGAGVQKVTALARRLQQLIETAELDRGSARREVRMAEDSGTARAEGSAAPSEEGATRDSSVDVDALAQEVTDAVTRELEMRQERRLDDPTGRSIWWE